LPTGSRATVEPAPALGRGASALVAGLERELKAAGTPERAVNEKRYLKSRLTFFGASVPAMHKVVTAFHKADPGLDRGRLIAIVKEMWASDIHELHMAAVELLDVYSGLLEAEDMALIERMVRTSYTWAYVDSLAASVAGRLVEKHPRLARMLDRWAKDGDFWLRRSAMLALLLPLRRGKGDWARFVRYADSMLEEKEFFIRKAIGWVLRDTSRKRPELVHEYLVSPRHKGEPARAAVASGLTVREAVKHLSQEQKAAVLQAQERARE